MRFSTVLYTFAVVAAGATGVSAADFSAEAVTSAASFSPQNFYGAPIPPWKVNHHPGWYYGKGTPPIGLHSLLDELFCGLLNLFPFGHHCPQPPHNPPPYTKVYGNLNCGSQDGSYQTYGVVEVVADCQAMCDSISGCIAFNTYHDVYGNGAATQLTCTLYEVPLTVRSASYCGGEHQPDGSIHHIINSDGYCKRTPTA